MLTIKLVKQFPPKLSWSSLVSLDYRYGTWLLLWSLKAFITLPKAVKLVLIFLASSKTFPSAPVFDIFSLPAKSTRHILAVQASPVYRSWVFKVIINSIWDLEEHAFMLVELTALFSMPLARWSKASVWVRIYLSVTFYRKIPSFLLALIFKSCLEISMRSLIFSL